MRDINEQLVEEINGAELETLQTQEESPEEDSFGALAKDIKEGNVTSEDVDDRIAALINEYIDIPMIPEGVESRLFGFAVDGVKVALVQIVMALDS